MTIVLHVGLPKTGTTTLQRHVFSKMRGVECYLNSGGSESSSFLDAIRRLERCSDSEATRLRDQHRQILDRTGKAPLLVSHENFTFPRKTNVFAVPQRLNTFAEGAKIVIVIRQQSRWLDSYYFYHQSKEIRRGKVEMPEEFISAEINKPNAGVFAATRYFDLWQSWSDVFGQENVHVLPYEILKESPEQFFGVFAELLGVDAADLVAAYEAAPREFDRISWADYFAGLNLTRIRRNSLWLYRIMKLAGIKLHGQSFVGDTPAQLDFATLLPGDIIDSWADQSKRLSEVVPYDLEGMGYFDFSSAQRAA